MMDTDKELREIEDDLAASFEQFRLAEGAYLTGTSASSTIAAQQFTARFMKFAEADCHHHIALARKQTRLEDRDVLARLHGEYANTPLEERLNGWHWLTIADERIAEIEKSMESKEDKDAE